MRAEKSRERSKQIYVYYRIKQSCTMLNQLVATNLNARIIQYFYTWRAQAQILKLPECINDIKIEANRKYSFFFKTLSSQVNGLYSKQHLLESEIEDHTLREQKYTAILNKFKSRTGTSPRMSLGDEDILIALEHENERLKSTLAKMESDVTLYFQGLSALIDRKAPQISPREINVLNVKPTKRKNNLLHLNLALF
jgi:hypothetical protein